jgi:hypothetical protein
MKTSTYIGVDPGQSGGIAIFRLADHLTLTGIETIKAADTHREELVKVLCDLDPTKTKVFAERVNGIPFNPKTGQRQSCQANFKFGLYTGLLMGTFQTLGFSDLQLVSPVKWQNYVRIERNKSDSQTQKKNRHKDLVTDIWGLSPKGKQYTHWETDAILIATYGLGVTLWGPDFDDFNTDFAV